jgi:hypothetical protein
MAKYVWKDPGGKVRIMFGCVALLAVMMLIDGLLKGDPLRALGGIVAWPFATFMVKGVPVPESWAVAVGAQVDGILSMRVGGSSDAFRWIAAGLGVAMAALAFLGAYVLVFGSLEAIESFLPDAARSIRRAEGRGAEMLERTGFAALFAVVGGIALFTAWKRARG